MTQEQQKVRDWMKAFGQECPEKPTIPSLEIRKLRAKLILEEALETCHALNMHPYLTRNHYEDDMIENDSIGFWEDKDQKVELSEISDGCSDLSVVNYGTLVACGLIKSEDLTIQRGPQLSWNDPLFDEVMRSNWTKLWTWKELHESEFMKQTVKMNVNGNSYSNANFSAKEITSDKWLVKDKDGKVIKSPSYSPANLQPIIDSL